MYPPVRRHLPWSFALAIALAAAPAAATLLPHRTLDELVADKTDVFRGKVVAVESFWNEDETYILTDVRVRVDETLLGKARGEAVLRLLGGRVEDVRLDVLGAAGFEKGEEVLVFARRGPDGRLYLPDLGLDKYTLEKSAEGTWIRSELPLASLVPDKALELDDFGRLPWEVFRQRLTGSMRGTKTILPPEDAAPEKVVAPPLRSFHVIGPGGIHGGESLCPQEWGPFAHWDLRANIACLVSYEINPNLMASNPYPAQVDPGPANIVTEITSAATTWTNVTPGHVTLFRASAASSCLAGPARDFTNCVSWNDTLWESQMWGRLNYGVTCIWRDAGTGVIDEADIVLNHRPNDIPTNMPTTWRLTPPDLTDPAVCGQTPIGIQAVVVHEFGHLLGLHHPDAVKHPALCANDDPNKETIMHSMYRDACQVVLHQADVDGANFLYSHDLGDLDPPYPTAVNSSDGPSHVFGIYPRFQYEWLGICCGKIDDNPNECEAIIGPPYDRFDDGGLLLAKCEGDKLEVDHVTFLVGVQTAADALGRTHPYDTTRPLYINAWFDWNDDGDFDDGGEHPVGGPRPVVVTRPAIYGFALSPPEGTPCKVSHRLRLDYREDVGRSLRAVDPNLNLYRYAARHGEVEDYVGPYDPDGKFNNHPNRPMGPEGKRLPVGSPFYCHIGALPVVFVGGGGAGVGGFCHPPRPWILPPGQSVGTTFPDAGSECMDSSLTFDIDFDEDGVFDETVGLEGPVCVTRSAPYLDDAGLRTIDTEMVSLEMTGHSEIAGALAVRLAPGFQTLGRIQQSVAAADLGIDVSEEAPADSYFNVYYVIDTEAYGISEVVGPVLAESRISAVPPGQPNGNVPGEPTEEVPTDEDADVPAGEEAEPEGNF